MWKTSWCRLEQPCTAKMCVLHCKMLLLQTWNKLAHLHCMQTALCRVVLCPRERRSETAIFWVPYFCQARLEASLSLQMHIHLEPFAKNLALPEQCPKLPQETSLQTSNLMQAGRNEKLAWMAARSFFTPSSKSRCDARMLVASSFFSLLTTWRTFSKFAASSHVPHLVSTGWGGKATSGGKPLKSCTRIRLFANTFFMFDMRSSTFWEQLLTSSATVYSTWATQATWMIFWYMTPRAKPAFTM